ncbi:hypothetical protein ANCCAN_12530 [Ancylostoma caninum]|uniref:Uncharacterized protein n=1 Tax=Ancylostoma caninum TaxID=29170 RepID=A0A368GAU2_ANCCA|nr:hypothetical protein ANCCAN_12530 [Ancylostoma caninum]
MNCYADVSMISATIQRVGDQCKMLVLCGPGTTFHYFTATGASDTLTTVGTLTCSMPPSGGTWVMPNGVSIDGMTCMSST